MIGHFINRSDNFIKQRFLKKYKINPQTLENAYHFFEFRKVDFRNLRNFDIENIFSSEENYSILIYGENSKETENSIKNLDEEFYDIFIKTSFNVKNPVHFRTEKKAFSETAVMGIVNVTPDSFSDGGNFLEVEKAVNHALQLLDSGADIIDIGGESTRPNSDPVSEKEELDRVIPVIEKLKKSRPEVLISIDTTKSKVAEEAINAGAEIINDISGASFDPEILDVASQEKVPIVLMHIKGNPKTMQKNPYYDDVISEIYDFLWERTILAKEAGISNIIIDPGIGFGKRIEDNYEILNRLQEFKGLGFPTLVGLSRKSFLGKSLNLDVNNRTNITAIAESVAIKNGVQIIRTHNVKNAVEARRVINFLETPELSANV